MPEHYQTFNASALKKAVWELNELLACMRHNEYSELKPLNEFAGVPFDFSILMVKLKSWRFNCCVNGELLGSIRLDSI